VTGRVELHAGGVKLFQNSTVTRPLVVAALLLGIAGRAAMSVQTLAVLLVTLMLPVLSYPGKVRFATTVDARLRTIRSCAERVRHDHPDSPRGVYNTVRPLPSHSPYYYLFRLGPWTEPDGPQPAVLHRRLFQPGEETLVVMTSGGYQHLRRLAADGTIAALPPAVVVDGVTIAMPGLFSRCAAAARAAGAQAPERGD
jgi:hypothetical protein